MKTSEATPVLRTARQRIRTRTPAPFARATDHSDVGDETFFLMHRAWAIEDDRGRPAHATSAIEVGK